MAAVLPVADWGRLMTDGGSSTPEPNQPGASGAPPNAAPGVPATATRAGADTGRALGLLLAVCGVVVGAGAFFSWLEVSVVGHTVALTGMNSATGGGAWWGDIAAGWWALIGGALIVVCGLVYAYTTSPGQRRSAGILAVITPAVVAVVSFGEYNHADDAASSAINQSIASNAGSGDLGGLASTLASNLVHYSMGAGLIAVLVGAGVALVVAIVLVVTANNAASTRPVTVASQTNYPGATFPGTDPAAPAPPVGAAPWTSPAATAPTTATPPPVPPSVPPPVPPAAGPPAEPPAGL